MSTFKLALARAGILAVVMVPAGAVAPPEAGAAVVTKCGPVIESTTRTEFAMFATQSTNFVNLPGAAVSVTVPDGETRCVKARLSLVANCSQTAAADVCGVRMAQVGVSVLNPPVNGLDMVAPTSEGYGAFTFQWVKRLEAGTHTIRPQLAVQNAMTTFTVQVWTFEVETSE